MKNKKNISYFNPSVTVDVVIFTIEEEKLKILLVKREHSPFRGDYALPGGFIKKGETTIDTAQRVLKDKAGVEGVYLEQLYTFDSLTRDPRGQVISVSHFALAPRGEIAMNKSAAAEHPEFVSIRSLPKLAFDHKSIVTYALKRLGDKIKYTNVIYSLLPEYFTFTELQKTYEIVLGRKFDKRNFRKKIGELALLKPSRKTRTGVRQRPAMLYSFSSNHIKELEKFFGGD